MPAPRQSRSRRPWSRIEPDALAQPVFAVLRDDVHPRPGDVGPWVLGGVMALVAMLGLGLASGAADDVFYGTGLGLFDFGVRFIFFLIHRHVGR
jgi:hypothetical protein